MARPYKRLSMRAKNRKKLQYPLDFYRTEMNLFNLWFNFCGGMWWLKDTKSPRDDGPGGYKVFY